MLPAPLAAQSWAQAIHAHLPEAFRMLCNLSYVGEVILSTSEKNTIYLRWQKLKRDGTGCTIGRIRQRAQGNIGKEA